MTSSGSILTHERDPRVEELRRRLDGFYATTTEYSDFQKQNFKDQYWGPILGSVRERVQAQGRCRVLEFGAGRTGFGEFLGELRPKVHFTVQDVTPVNRDGLAGQADAVHIGDVTGLSGPFDVIFSTFVWEHVTDPKRVLDHLLGSLAPGGSLFIACPRYDLPGYVPPSARHYSKPRQYLLTLRIGLRRLMTGMGGSPAFWIHLDPAMFHRPWFIDADAVHWPSAADLKRSLPRGYRMERIGFEHRNFKQWVFGRFLLLFVRIRREGGVVGPAANRSVESAPS